MGTEHHETPRLAARAFIIGIAGIRGKSQPCLLTVVLIGNPFRADVYVCFLEAFFIGCVKVIGRLRLHAKGSL